MTFLLPLLVLLLSANQNSLGKQNGAFPLPPNRGQISSPEALPSPGPTTSIVALKLGQTYAVEDFNADGIPDVVLADFFTDQVKVLLGDGMGNFHLHTGFPSTSGPRAISVADFNKDSRPDLAIANFFSGTVSIFLGSGEGSFNYLGSIQLDRGLSSLVAADFNSDGITDLAVSNFLSGQISLLLGVGDGFFQNRGQSLGQIPGIALLVNRDLNGDRVQDLAAFDASGREAWFSSGAGSLSSSEFVKTDPLLILNILEKRSEGRPQARETLTLRKLFGDGQAVPVGGVLPQPLVLEVTEQDGSTQQGRQVRFSTLMGTPELDDRVFRITDPQGKAGIQLSSAREAGTYLVGATVSGDSLAVFGLAFILPVEDYFKTIGEAAAQLKQ